MQAPGRGFPAGRCAWAAGAAGVRSIMGLAARLGAAVEPMCSTSPFAAFGSIIEP